jgi:tetratricopeptide (TPR) repeat protein
VSLRKLRSTFLLCCASAAVLHAQQAPAGKPLEEAQQISSSDPARSMEIATAELEKSQQTGNKLGSSSAYLLLGELHFNNGNYERAATFFGYAADGFRSLKMQSESLQAENKQSDALAKAGNTKDALLKKRKVAVSSNFKPKEKAELVNQIAVLESKSGNKDKARELLKENIRNNADTIVTLNAINQLSNLYIQSGQTDSAMALMTSNQVLIIHSKSADAKTYLWNFGDANTQSGYTINSSPTLIPMYNQIASGALASGNFPVAQQAYFNLGGTYMLQGEHGPAIQMFQASLETSEKTNDKAAARESWLKLSEAHEKNGNLKEALAAYRQYMALADSFRQEDILKEVRQLGLNEQFARQEERIRNLETNELRKQWELGRQRQVLIAMAVVLLLFSGLLFWLIRTLRERQRASLRNRLQSLRNQMNPHFIFNSLNSVNHYISIHDERAANQFLSDFSTLMRRVMSNSARDFISLREELDILKVYASLEQARFAERFELQWELDEMLPLDEIEVPPLLFQPYVENAVWHGLRYRDTPGWLHIAIRLNEGMLEAVITDNGIGRQKSAALKTANQKRSEGTGLKNTAERLYILNRLHRTRVAVSVSDAFPGDTHTGTRVCIQIPVHQPAHA